MKIGICIITYKRPIYLNNLLESIQSLKKIKNEKLEYIIIVVDNDKCGSANEIVNKFDKKIDNLLYQIEPRKGISFARNTCIAIARKYNCSYIAFVDDDEKVQANWLDELAYAIIKYEADVVFGPVVPNYEQNVPKWIIDGKFFERPRFTTGEITNSWRTGNVLIRLSVLEKFDKPFDTEFALTGGEDTYLFMKLKKMGVKMIWCDEAIVEEFISSERASLKWLIKRSYRMGSTYSLCEKKSSNSTWQLFVRLNKSIFRVALWIILLIPMSFHGTKGLVKALIQISDSIGQASGIFGMKYLEYKD